MGCELGCAVGCLEGCLEGWAVGCREGLALGWALGWTLGFDEGWLLGCRVGCCVGCREGCPVGWPVGSAAPPTPQRRPRSTAATSSSRAIVSLSATARNFAAPDAGSPNRRGIIPTEASPERPDRAPLMMGGMRFASVSQTRDFCCRLCPPRASKTEISRLLLSPPCDDSPRSPACSLITRLVAARRWVYRGKVAGAPRFARHYQGGASIAAGGKRRGGTSSGRAHS